VAGGRGDLDRVMLAVQAAGKLFDFPTGHLSGVVAAFAFSATVGIDRQTTIREASDVIDVADRRVTEWIPAPPIPKHDQLSEEAIELAAQGITAG
jgi:hypothetical protein